MLKLRTEDGTFILGIDAENVRRLKIDNPILADLTDMGGPRVVIAYNDTIEGLMEKLGIEVPEPEGQG